VFIRVHPCSSGCICVHLWLIGFFFLCVLRVLCGENLSFEAAHHANYGGPKSRRDNPQTIALFSPCPWRLWLASFPLCDLCALVVNVFFFFRPPTTDQRRTTTAHEFALPSAVVRRLCSFIYHPSSLICPLCPLCLCGESFLPDLPVLPVRITDDG
jgi:hypothetical protein